MQISTKLLFDRGAQQMSQVQDKLAKLQVQLSHGKQVVNPSDEPDKAAAILRLNSVLSRQASYQESLNNVRTRLSAEENALTSASDLLIRLKEVSLQAANDTNGPADRLALATEMQALRDQLLSLSNSQDSNGNYLFAGSRVRQPAFSADANGKIAYMGDQNRMQVSIGDARSISVNRTGTDVFNSVARSDAMQIRPTVTTADGGPDATETSLISFVNGLAGGESVTIAGLTFTAGPDGATAAQVASAFTDLDVGDIGYGLDYGSFSGTLTGFNMGPINSNGTSFYATSTTANDNVTDIAVSVQGNANSIGFFQSLDELIDGVKNSIPLAMNQGMNDLDQMLKGVTQAQAQVGSSLSGLEHQSDVIDATVLNLKTTLSNLQDLDYATAVTDMNKQMLSLEAAQSSFAKISQLNLFNFLR
jgi:flagellar hook-associated protein 3 FlgL